MHNSITVSFIKDLFKVTVAVNLQPIIQKEEIKTAKEANEIALQFLNKYKKQGIEIEIFQPW